jgi:16S rRNA (guanine527-N7)-methyltransferase
MGSLDANRERALTVTPVSRETLERLDRFVALLLTWQRRINLIAPSTVEELWTRHVADSLQLLDLAPGARTWIDLGSGGGFPGMPIACALAETPGAEVHLIESNNKKAAFLREAARATGAPVKIHPMRIEKFVDGFEGAADVVAARALAGLKVLLKECFTLLRRGTLGLFPKGQDVDAELTQASRCWNMTWDLVPSLTDPKGRIVVVRSLEHHKAAHNTGPIRAKRNREEAP